MRKISILILLLFMVACSQDEAAQPTSPSPLSTVTHLQPTPTLVAHVGELPTAVPTIPPTATPQPAERLSIAQGDAAVGDWDAAAEQLEASLAQADGLTDAQQTEASAELGEVYMENGRFTEAIPLLTDLPLARAYESTGDYATAITAYETYAAANPEMGAYVNRAIAQNWSALGNHEMAIASYEASLDAPQHYLITVDTRTKLAQFYEENGRFQEAIAQYDAIRNIAQTEYTKGEMMYLSGLAALADGDEFEAHTRFETAVNSHPTSPASYDALIALVEAGWTVDEFQRGLVDYYADAYEPAAAAFNRVLATEPNHAEARLYLAKTYEAVGNLPAAADTLAQYALNEPEAALIEQAALAARMNDGITAVSLYTTYLQQYPDGEFAPEAAWQTAVYSPDWDTAVTNFQAFASAYPAHEDAAEGLFRAGWAALQTDVTPERAIELWQETVTRYPESPYGAKAAVWLLRQGEEVGDIPLSTDFYALRVDDGINGRSPFTRPDSPLLPLSPASQIEAETWLAEQVGLDTLDPIAPALATDERLLIGTKLWEAGMYQAAKLELEALRQDVADDPLLTYHLALYFRDLGLYRSSILAAVDLLEATGATVFTAPKFIGQLAYPVYYDELVLTTAEQYGYDPLIQFALLRQESLFESFARSGAAAQGLSQVIPDTGAYIAQRLNWPDYVNEDLYKPYVGVAFGGYYLDQQIDAFDGTVHAALSAYNGGPGNAARWYGTAGDDIDLYVETVDFPETRSYIERIYSGYDIYRYLYAD